MASVEFFGETFHLVSEPNEFALMEYADSAEQVEVNTMPAMAATFRLLQESIGANPDDPESTEESEFMRFRLCARRNRADLDVLMPVIFAVFNQAADRPTGRPSVSSDGPEPTPLRSVSPPVEQAMERLAGRPDLQAALLITRGQLKAVSA